MKYENYYETLTPMQKKKWSEKKGPILYREWYDMISKNLDLETAGALVLAILFYDNCAGTKPIPQKYMKILKKDATAMVLLDTYIPATAAASRQWINRHKLIGKGDNAEENTATVSDSKNVSLEYLKKLKEQQKDTEYGDDDLPF